MGAWWWNGWLALLLLIGVLGCQRTECGNGTWEDDGVCVLPGMGRVRVDLAVVGR